QHIAGHGRDLRKCGSGGGERHQAGAPAPAGSRSDAPCPLHCQSAGLPQADRSSPLPGSFWVWPAAVCNRPGMMAAPPLELESDGAVPSMLATMKLVARSADVGGSGGGWLITALSELDSTSDSSGAGGGGWGGGVLFAISPVTVGGGAGGALKFWLLLTTS